MFARVCDEKYLYNAPFDLYNAPFYLYSAPFYLYNAPLNLYNAPPPQKNYLYNAPFFSFFVVQFLRVLSNTSTSFFTICTMPLCRMPPKYILHSGIVQIYSLITKQYLRLHICTMPLFVLFRILAHGVIRPLLYPPNPPCVR